VTEKPRRDRGFIAGGKGTRAASEACREDNKGRRQRFPDWHARIVRGERGRRRVDMVLTGTERLSAP
jgi:hypothetical protein